MINMTEFAANVPNLRSNDQGFASSLISQFSRKNSLSDKQWYWVKKLANSAKHGYEPAAVVEAEELGSFGGVFELLQTATANLKFPKVRLVTRNGQTIILKINGPRSKTPGQISVTDGSPYGSGGKYFGRVDGTAGFVAHHRVSQEDLDDVMQVLCELATDPAATAAKYGKLTGNCCFCHKPVGEGEDKRSVEIGYGPTCAKNFGLPWGV